MSGYQIQIASGVDQFVHWVHAWNDLWARSCPAQPTSRAEGVLDWVEAFAEDEPFSAVCVEADGRLVAGLPLVRSSLGGVLQVYRRPISPWSDSGTLLLDRSVDAVAALDTLVDGLDAAGVHLMSFEETPFEQPQWAAFAEAVSRRGGYSLVTAKNTVGVVDILNDWDRYQKSWSGNHRGAIKRSLKKLEKKHTVRLERHRSAEGIDLDGLLDVAFQIEDRTWKGDAGTSVLKCPGMAGFIKREARRVADAGSLDLWFLYADDTPIAFEYCHLSGGTCYSHKIGYDPDYAAYGPGRLLRRLQLERLHDDPECGVLDMLGVICPTKAKWATRTYPIGRLHASIRGVMPQALLRGYGWVKPALQKLRQSETVVPQLGAAGLLPPGGVPVGA